MTKIAIGSDHAGLSLKEELITFLREAQVDVEDVGTHSADSVDYPDIASAIGIAIHGGHASKAILLCGSGVGASVAANKIKGVRAGLCHDTYSAHQGVEHDDMNVLCLGARVVGPEVAKELVDTFLKASFLNEERHVRRLRKIRQLEILLWPPEKVK